jgi:hypothetical protein
MSGGPRPLSWGPARPTAAYIRECEPGPGEYTFQLWKGSVVIETVTFQSTSLRAAQDEALRRAKELGGTFASTVASPPVAGK